MAKDPAAKKWKPKAKQFDAIQFTGANELEIIGQLIAVSNAVTWRIWCNTESPYRLDFQHVEAEGVPSFSGDLAIGDWLVLDGVPRSLTAAEFSANYEEG